ncbi:uncharacterized protein LOC134221573 [Armigeres subalbatus]|uniref:uncharacterized protein LOC134221573 n=1 Tax=Armigeres subalbatus TaxID=124917 RepID=UPI002ED087BE
MFDDADLVEIGITAKGPRKIILASIEKIRTTCDSQLASMEIEKTPEELLRDVLIQDPKFRCFVYDELDRNIVPCEKNLRLMVRILCQRFEKIIYDKKGYPSSNEQWILAKQIIRAFPQLANTRTSENAPDESAFFWWHSGKSTGQHSGYIFHRVRNIIKGLPKEMKKYKRPDITNKAQNSVPTALVQRATDLAELYPDSQNNAEITRGMEECFPLHQLLLKEQKSVKDMLSTLPHLASYNGTMIHDAFYRLNPTAPKQLELASILGRGLLLTPGIFKEVEDGNL